MMSAFLVTPSSLEPRPQPHSGEAGPRPPFGGLPVRHRNLVAATALAAALALGSAASAQHAAPDAPKGTTASLQGGAAEWIADPHWRTYYDMTKAAFAGGPGKVDVEAYEQKSFALFRDFGKSKGVDPAH